MNKRSITNALLKSEISLAIFIPHPKSITSLLRRGGRPAGLARAWFANVQGRKNLINCAKNKLSAAVDIIATKHPSERIMIFSETIESIQMLKEMLQNRRINSMLIDSKLKSKERQKILSEWGKELHEGKTYMTTPSIRFHLPLFS